MAIGRSTGLQYDDWYTQTPVWDLDEIRHEPPLLRHEAIVAAMDERQRAHWVDFPSDDGLNYRNIADHGYLNDQFFYDLVAEWNVEKWDFWVDYKDNGGNWHGQNFCCKGITEEEIALDIDPLGSGVLSRVEAGDLYTAEFVLEQYNILNRQLWFYDSLANFTFQDQGYTRWNFPKLPTLVLQKCNGIVSAESCRTIFEIGKFGGSTGEFLGQTAEVTVFNTLNAWAPDAWDDVPPTGPGTFAYISPSQNDAGQFFQSVTAQPETRFVRPFGINKEYDGYYWATGFPIFHDNLSTDQWNSPLNGTIKIANAFIDHTGKGILDQKWTRMGDAFRNQIGGGQDYTGSGDGGWLIKLPKTAVREDIVHDPQATYGDAYNITLPGILVTRCDVPGGLEFTDPAINPSATISVPPAIFPHIEP